MTATRLILPPVDVAQRTDPGRDPDKQVNEDACRYAETPFGHLAVLCDGMGGHEGGQRASNLALQTIFRYFEAAAPRADVPLSARAREILRDAILVANKEVFALGEPGSHHKPGSTVVAVLLHPFGAEIAHVGDSRCYLVQGGQTRQVTRDHSVVQRMVDAGQLTPEQAAVHPDANRITRALGIAPTVDVEVQRSSLLYAAGDAFVLCSDGLSDLVSAPEIGQACASSTAQEAPQRLVDLANQRGGHDNITVVVVQARQPALASPEPPPDVPVPRSTNAMPAIAPPPNAPWPGPGRPSPGPVLHPAARPRDHRRKLPVVVFLGMVLGLLGVAAIGVVIFLVVTPRKGANLVPSLMLTPSLPSASMSAVPVEPLPEVTPDGGDGLPSLDAGWGIRRRKGRAR